MAKKKLGDELITCVAYNLSITNDADGPVFNFNVDGDDDAKYHLIVREIGVHKDLIENILKKLGTIWHQKGFKFLANEDNEIIEIQ